MSVNSSFIKHEIKTALQSEPCKKNEFSVSNARMRDAGADGSELTRPLRCEAV